MARQQFSRQRPEHIPPSMEVVTDAKKIKALKKMAICRDCAEKKKKLPQWIRQPALLRLKKTICECCGQPKLVRQIT